MPDGGIWLSLSSLRTLSYNMPILTIDARDFFRGISTSNELGDGGFSPDSKGVNLFASPGLLLPGQAPVDAAGAAAATKGIFGWCPQSSNSDVAFGIGANNTDDGKLYTVGPTGAVALNVTEATRDYIAGRSDIIRYAGLPFVTSTTGIGIGNATGTTLDPAWWTTTLGKTALGINDPHPMIEYGGILYIADGRYIHSWDGSTGTYNALDLPVGYVITALANYGNLIFIAAANTSIGDAADASNVRIFTWDGYSASFLDEFVVQERIDALIPFGGTLFVTTKKYFGYFTGSTVSPLHPLTSSVYKYQVAVTNDRLYMVQGADILCYGNPSIARPKFFSFPLKHPSSLTSIASFQAGKLIYSYASTTGGWSNVNGSDQTGNVFYGNKIPFGRQVRIRSVIVESEALASGSVIDVAYLDDTGSTVTVGAYSHAARGAISKFKFDLFNKTPTVTIQPKITFTTGPNKGIRRIHVYYEPSELKENK